MISKSVRLAVAVALAMSFAVAPAVATEPASYGTVPYHYTIKSKTTTATIDLFGKSETEARTIIAANAMPAMKTINVYAVSSAGKSLRRVTFYPQKYVSLDMTTMISSLYSDPGTTSPVAMTKRFKVNSTGVYSWIRYNVAPKVNAKPTNATRVVKNRRLYVKKEVWGRTTNLKVGTSRLVSAIGKEAANGGTPVVSRVNVPATSVRPAIRSNQLGKAILVVQGKRKLYLYNGAKIIRTYGVAVGQPGYPTPKGTFKVIAKNPHPAWYNPGSDWAKNMPAYIPPGPSNPLGLRALYLDAPGIRIHGTSNVGSIGTAASHGCIRVANYNIVKLYPLVPVGTTVYIVK